MKVARQARRMVRFPTHRTGARCGAGRSRVGFFNQSWIRPSKTKVAGPVSRTLEKVSPVSIKGDLQFVAALHLTRTGEVNPWTAALTMALAETRCRTPGFPGDAALVEVRTRMELRPRTCAPIPLVPRGFEVFVPATRHRVATMARSASGTNTTGNPVFRELASRGTPAVPTESATGGNGTGEGDCHPVAMEFGADNARGGLEPEGWTASIRSCAGCIWVK